MGDSYSRRSRKQSYETYKRVAVYLWFLPFFHARCSHLDELSVRPLTRSLPPLSFCVAQGSLKL